MNTGYFFIIIIFCWVLVYVGLSENEQADLAAKEAVNLEQCQIRGENDVINLDECLIPPSNFRPTINYYILK